MFNDVNSVQLLGNVTNDPDLRFTPGGAAVLNFGLATNRRYKKGEEWVDDTTFHNIVIWGNQAQSLAQRVNKGTRLFLTGRLQVRSWDDNTGKKQYKTEIVADEVSLISRYNEGKSADLPTPVASTTSNTGSSTPPKASAKSAEPVSEPDIEFDSSIDPDDLPF